MKFTLTLTAILFIACAHAQAPVPGKDEPPQAINIDSLKEFKTVQIQAQFPGGPSAWVAYLQKNLRAEVGAEYIRLRRKQIDSLQTVVVSYLVDTQGNVSEVKVENPEHVHPKVGAEAVRVIQNGPKWAPAIQNGKYVIYRQRQSITFQVTKG